MGKFIAWLGISMVAFGAVMLLVIAVAVWAEGLWPLTLMLGVFGLIAGACAVAMARETLRA